jgi:hypothetical protein
MKRFPCRCKKCKGRKTFRIDPTHYNVEPLCACGGTYSVDTYRKTKENKKRICYCDTYWFPHKENYICRAKGIR